MSEDIISPQTSLGPESRENSEHGGPESGVTRSRITTTSTISKLYIDKYNDNVMMWILDTYCHDDMFEA